MGCPWTAWETPTIHWLHSQSKPVEGGIAPATAQEAGVQLPGKGQSQTPSVRGSRPGSSLTERWKRLGWGTQHIQTRAWRPSLPQPSVSSSLAPSLHIPHLQTPAEGRALKGGARGACQFPCSCCKGQEQMTLGRSWCKAGPLLDIFPSRLLGSKHPSHR